MTKDEQYVQYYSFAETVEKKQEYIANKMGITLDEVRELRVNNKQKTDEIQKIRNKFTGQRRIDFGNDFIKFYNWYSKEVENGAKCGYCGISQEELIKFFKEKNVLPLNDAVKRSSGTLEIERKDSSTNNYGSENIILACPLCNNAKSNLIDESSWRNFFVEPMRQYYAKLLCTDLSNPIPSK